VSESFALISYRLRTVRVGVQATFFVLACLTAFLLIPSDITVNESVYIATLVVAAVGGAVISLLPWLKLFQKGLGMPVMYAWSVFDIVLITIILSAVGTTGPPFFFILYALTTVFAAASYRPLVQAVLFGFTLAAYVTMVLLLEDMVVTASMVVRFGALAGVAYITGFLSRELQSQNERLAREVSEHKATEARLRASEAQLEEAQRVAHLGSWEWNAKTDELSWSDELLRIFGVDTQSFGADYESFISAVHPEAREWVDELVRDAYRNVQPLVFEHRIVRPDGSERVLFARGRVEMDRDGEATRMVGTTLDLTEQKKAERAERDLAELSARQQQAMEINDNVVQGLTVASYSLEAGEEERARKAVRATLTAARGIVEKLLSGRLDQLKPGDFVRSEPARIGTEEKPEQ